MKNFIREVFDTDATWTAPAGVKHIHVSCYTQSNLLACGEAFQLMRGASNVSNSLTFLSSVGLGTSGQLGDGTIVSKSNPVQVLAAIEGAPRLIASGGTTSHMLMGDETNILWCWGTGSQGQMGDGNINNRSTPTSNTFLRFTQSKKNLTKKIVDGNSGHGLALTTSKAIYAYGINTNGQLGTGNTTNISNPAIISGTWKNIGIGNDHSLAIDSSGNAYAWGLNTSGQMGDNTVVSKSTPTAVVASGRKFTQIAGGLDFSYALTEDGDIYSWGANSFGQLGDNTTTPKSVPVLVSAGTKKFYRIASTKGQFGLAMDMAGNAYAWGLNSSGQLGDNTTTNRSTPVLVTGGLQFSDLAGGGAFASGYAQGGFYSWGLNSSGQVGDGTTVNKSSPVAISTQIASSMVNVAYGSYTPRRLLSRQVMDVVPGQSYPITLFGFMAAVGAIALATGSYPDQTIELEYFI